MPNADPSEQTGTARNRPPVFNQIDHHYGPQVHILNDPYSLTLLASLSHRETTQPAINRLIEKLYEVLFHTAVAEHLPLTLAQVETRLVETNPEAVWQGPVAAPETKAVVVALARAGVKPANFFYECLNEILTPSGVRQDYFMINRVTDDEGAVTGAAISGCKVGGPVEDAVVLIPDPMGATGSSVLEVLRHYARKVEGKPKRVVLFHLVVTPEYLRNVLRDYPEAHIVSLRLDRGLSPEAVLREKPGRRWDEERGLNDSHYIVPGIGGLGEMMNNSWI